MKTLTKTIANTDDIKGVTFEERARLVLATLGKTPDDIRKAAAEIIRRERMVEVIVRPEK